MYSYGQFFKQDNKTTCSLSSFSGKTYVCGEHVQYNMHLYKKRHVFFIYIFSNTKYKSFGTWQWLMLQIQRFIRRLVYNKHEFYRNTKPNGPYETNTHGTDILFHNEWVLVFIRKRKREREMKNMCNACICLCKIMSISCICISWFIFSIYLLLQSSFREIFLQKLLNT